MFASRPTFTETGDSLLTLRILRPLRLGVCGEFSVLKVLAGHPEGRASLADLTRYVSILISSGTDWTNRTKRLAARAPKLDIFADSFVLRDDRGWQITESGRQFLASLEAPLSIGSESAQAAETATTKAPQPPAPPPLRLVVNNEKQPPDGREACPLAAIGLIRCTALTMPLAGPAVRRSNSRCFKRECGHGERDSEVV